MQCRAENAYTTLLKAMTTKIPSQGMRFERKYGDRGEGKTNSHHLANCG